MGYWANAVRHPVGAILQQCKMEFLQGKIDLQPLTLNFKNMEEVLGMQHNSGIGLLFVVLVNSDAPLVNSVSVALFRHSVYGDFMVLENVKTTQSRYVSRFSLPTQRI